MSTEVENRVVRMTFDNAKFEAGVKTTMSSLEHLKESLKFDNILGGLNKLKDGIANLNFNKVEENAKNTSKVFDDINKQNFNSVDDAVLKLTNRFSNLGIVGMTVIQNLTNTAMDFVKNVGGKLYSNVFGQIKEGGLTRALNLEQAQFQIQGMGVDWKEIQDTGVSLYDQINEAVSGTAYGLDSAAKVAGQLLASSVGAGSELMQNTLKAISGVAAMTNKSYDEVGHIFTTIAGNGRVMGMQLTQLSTYGLNAAATLAQELGVTEEEVRDMVSKGQISFELFAEAMNKAFGEQAKRANDTYAGSLSNVKAALSRIGAEVQTPKLVMMRDIFNGLIPVLNGVKGALGPVYELTSDIMGRISAQTTGFLSSLIQDDSGRLTLLDKMTNSLQAFKEALTWRDDNKGTGSREEGTDAIDYAYDSLNAIARIIKVIFKSISDITSAIFRGFSSVSEGGNMIHGVLHTVANALEWVHHLVIAVIGGITKALNQEGSLEKFAAAVGSTVIMIKTIIGALTQNVAPFLTNVFRILGGVLSIIVPPLSKIVVLVTSLVTKLFKSGIWYNLSGILNGIGKAITWIVGALAFLLEKIGWLINHLDSVFRFLWKIVKILGSGLLVLLYPLYLLIKLMVDSIRLLVEKIKENKDALEKFQKPLEVIKEAFKKVGESLTALKDRIIGFITKAFEPLRTKIQNGSGFFAKFANKLAAGISKIANWIDKLADRIRTFLNEHTTTVDRVTALNEKVTASVNKFVTLVKEKVINTIENLRTNIKKFIAEHQDTINKIIDLGKTLGNNVKKVGQTIWENVKKLVSNIPKAIKNIAGFIVLLFKSPRLALNEVRRIFEDLWVALKKYFKRVRDIIRKIKDVFKEFFGLVDYEGGTQLGDKLGKAFAKVKNNFHPLQALANMLTTVKSKLVDFIEFWKGFGKGISEGYNSTVDESDKTKEKIVKFFTVMFEAFKIGMKMLLEALKEFGIWVKDKVKAALHAVGDFFANLDYEAIGEKVLFVIKKALAIFFTVEMVQFAKYVSTLMTSLKQIVNPLSAISGLRFKSFAEQFRDVATGILMITASILILALLPADKLKRGVLAIISIVAVLAGFVWVMGKVNKQLAVDKAGNKYASIGSMIVGLAAGILVIAVAVRMLEKMNSEQILNAMAGITMIILAIALVIYTFGQMAKNMNQLQMPVVRQLTSLFIKLSAAVLVIAACIRILGFMDPEQLKTATLCLGLISGLIFALAVMMLNSAGKLDPAGAKKQTKAISKVVNIISKMLWQIGIVLRILGNMSADQINSATLAMVVILSFIMLLTKLILSYQSTKQVSEKDNNTFLKVAGGIFMILGAIAFFIVALEKTISVISKNNIGAIILALGIMAAVIVGLVVVAKQLSTVNGDAIMKASVGLLALGVAMIFLAVGLQKLNRVKFSSVLKMALALTVLVVAVVALAAASEYVGFSVFGLAALAATLLVLSVSIAIFGAGLILVGKGLEFISNGFELLAKSFGRMLDSIDALIPKIVGLIEHFILELIKMLTNITGRMVEYVIYAIDRICDAIIRLAPKIGKTLVTIVENILPVLREVIPELIDFLIQVGIDVLNGLADRMPDIMHAIKRVIEAFKEALKVEFGITISKEDIWKIIEAVGAITILLVALAVVGHFAVAALKGVLVLAAVIAAMVVLMVALGELSRIDGFEWVLGEGARMLGLVGEGIGNFIGGITKAFTEQVASTLPSLGANLSLFMRNLSDFIKIGSSITWDLVAGIFYLALSIASIAAGEFIMAVTEFISGKDMILEFGRDIVSLAPFIVQFANIISTLKEEDLMKAYWAGQIVRVLAASVPATTLLDSIFFKKDSTIETFAQQLPILAAGVFSYIKILTLVSIEDLKKAVLGTEMLVSIIAVCATIPNSGGLAGAIMGENDADAFGKMLPILAAGLVAYCNIIRTGNLDKDIIDLSVECGKAIVELVKTFPNSGGLLGVIMGENDADKFGHMLPILAMGLVRYSKIIKNGKISPSDIVISVAAAKGLVEIANALPNSGGVAGFFAGNNDIDEFGKKIVKFGTGLVGYYNQVKLIKFEKVNAANIAAKNLVKMAITITALAAYEITKVGSGADSFKKFGEHLSGFGDSIKKYADKVKDLPDISKKQESVSALIKEYLEVANQTDQFKNGNSLNEFGTAMGAMGDALEKYFSKILDKVPESDDPVYGQIKTALNSIINSLSVIKDNEETFTKLDVKGFKTCLTTIADAITYYGETLSEHNYTSLTNGSILNTITAVLNQIGTILTYSEALQNATDATKDFKASASNIGDGLNDYITGVEDLKTSIDYAKITTAISEIIKQISLVNESSELIQNADLSTFETVASQLGNGLGSYFDGFKKMGTFNTYTDSLTSMFALASDGAKNLDDLHNKSSLTASTGVLNGIIEQIKILSNNKELFEGLKDLDFAAVTSLVGKGIVGYLDPFVNSGILLTESEMSKYDIKSVTPAFKEILSQIKIVSDNNDMLKDVQSSRFETASTNLGKGLHSFINSLSDDNGAVTSYRSLDFKSYESAVTSILNMLSTIKLYNDSVNKADTEGFITASENLGTGLQTYYTTMTGVNFGKGGVDLSIDSKKLNPIESALRSIVGQMNWMATSGFDSTKTPSTSFKTGAQYLAEGLKAYYDGIKDLNYKDIKDGVELKANGTTSKFGDLVKTIVAQLTTLSTHTTTLSMDTETTANFASHAANLAYGIKSYVNTLSGVDFKKYDSDKVISIFKIIDGQFDDFEKKDLDAVNEFIDLLNSLKVASTSITEAYNSLALNMVDHFIAQFDNAAEDVETKGEEFLENFQNGLKNGAVTVSGYLTNVLIPGLSFPFTMNSSSFETIGKDFVDGLAKGIRENSGSASQASTEVAQAIITAARKALDEHSPSKEGTDIGQMFDTGVAIGIINYTAKVEKATQGMSDSILDLMHRTVSQVATYTDDGLNSAPSVTPVFDASSFVKDLNNAQGLMDNGLTYSIASTVSQEREQAAKDIANVKVETVNDDVVEAIYDLKNHVWMLKQNMDNMKVYLDGDKMVGGMSSRMDNSLGKETMMIGRKMK